MKYAQYALAAGLALMLFLAYAETMRADEDYAEAMAALRQAERHVAPILPGSPP